MTVAQLYASFGLQVDEASFKKADALIKNLRRSASNLVAGFGIALGVRGITSFVQEATHAGTHILGMATALGMSTEKFQEWSYVAKRAGSDANQFAVGVSMFERNLKEFAAGRGSKRFKESMAAVGMSVADAKHALASPDGINNAIFKVADAYKRMGNTAERAAINTGLFGQRARGMAQDLSQGSGPLREQIKSIHDAGGILSEEELATLKKADNTLLDLKTQLHVIAMRAVVAFGPQLITMLQSASRWIHDNAETIQNILGGALKSVALLFRILGTAVSGFVGIFGSWSGQVLTGFLALWKFRGLIAVFAGLQTAARGVRLEMELMAALEPYRRAQRVLDMTDELNKMKGAFPGLNPKVWANGAGGMTSSIGGALTKMGLLVAAFYVGWKIGTYIRENWDSIKKVLGEIADGFRELGSAVYNGLTAAWDWIRNTATEVGDWIWDKLSWPFRKIGGFFSSVGSAIGDAASFVGDKLGITSSSSGRDFSADVIDRTQGSQVVSRGAGGGDRNTTVTVHVGDVHISAKDVKDGGEKTADEIGKQIRHAAAAGGGDVS